MPGNPAVGTVVSTERCTSGKSAHYVRHIAFDVSGTQLAGTFRPGQSFGVIPPGLDEHGKPHKLRLYSLACPTRGEDGHGNVISTTVKRTIDEHWDTHRLFLGVASNYLCDLKPGDKANLTGPSGRRFLLPVRYGEHNYVFFATGTGIAPFRGMLMDLLAADSRSRIWLIMGSPYATDLLYDSDFRGWAAEHPRFRYLAAVSRQPQEDGHPPMYVQDRLASHREELAPLLESPRTLIYICGLAGMEMGIFQRLAQILPPAAWSQYLEVDPSVPPDPKAWERRMLPKLIHPTRRVFVEVY